MISIATTIALALVSLAAVLFLGALLRKRSLANRIVALDAILMSVVSGVAIQAAATGDDTYLNIMVVTALLAFVGTGLVARFVERRGA